ncbi:SCO3374 family protein [Streptomyces sp. NPDC053086]|uniref:SCO3374 family protein n=1 Tax=unclassified Streptomyces TaxID=2593676 RepID=UPI0037D5355C
MTSTVPLPRRPIDPDARARHWYENGLGWPTVPGRPLRLLTGVRFDVLDVPAEAGAKALRHLAPGSPVILRGDRMELLVAPGSAEELPGLLDWLEWGTVPLDLRVLGQNGTLEAPPPPAGTTTARLTSVQHAPARLAPAQIESVRLESVRSDSPGARSARVEPARAASVQGAVAGVWLRPPGPGGEVVNSLPAVPAMPAGSGVGREGTAPDLVRLVDTVAAQCHRARLWSNRAGNPADRRNQPLAFSYASRIDAGTRPRSLTS